MGEPVKIYDLAKNIIKLSGYRPEIDIEIKEIGLRPGEKLYEELLMNEERLKSTQHSKIFIGKQIDISLEDVEMYIKKLVEAEDSQDKALIRKTMHEAVPTFKEPQEVNPAAAMVH
jgi:FlaA1/EpsC-like NDP-sugar epimerase